MSLRETLSFIYSARMVVKNKGRVTGVGIRATMDIDPIMLSTLTNTVTAVGNLVKFSVNKVKVNLDLLEDSKVDPAQWKFIKRVHFFFYITLTRLVNFVLIKMTNNCLNRKVIKTYHF